MTILDPSPDVPDVRSIYQFPTDVAGDDMEGATAMELLIRRYLRGKMDRGEFNRRSATCVGSHLRLFSQSTNARPDRITRRTVERWMETPGLSPAYRRARLSSLRGFCQWCVLEGHMRRDPTLGLRAPPVPKGLPRALNQDHSALLVATCHTTRIRLIILLMLQEGLRRCEVSRALYPDLDLRRSTRRQRQGRGWATDPDRAALRGDDTGTKAVPRGSPGDARCVDPFAPKP